MPSPPTHLWLATGRRLQYWLRHLWVLAGEIIWEPVILYTFSPTKTHKCRNQYCSRRPVANHRWVGGDGIAATRAVIDSALLCYTHYVRILHYYSSSPISSHVSACTVAHRFTCAQMQPVSKAWLRILPCIYIYHETQYEYESDGDPTDRQYNVKDQLRIWTSLFTVVDPT